MNYSCTEPLYPLYTPDARNFSSVNTSSSASSAFSPVEIDRAYGLTSTSIDGQGITVAVIDAFGNSTIKEDFASFGTRFSLAKNSLEVYYPDGMSISQPQSWIIESCADTQWVYAVAPRARIMCVFAVDARIESLFSAVDFAVRNGADIISMSWGSPEFFGQNRYSEQMKNSGKIFIASAGDTGGEVLFPSSSDAVVSVGGTVLHRRADGQVFTRSAWINGGGGPSRYTGIPSWQEKFNPIPSLSDAFRATPDVALDASPMPGYAVYSSKNGGVISVGGTSVSAPVFAGITARLLQTNRSVLEGITLPEYLYKLAGETEYNIPQYYFDDITVGSNGKHDALVGYDMCTGLGAPRSLIP